MILNYENTNLVNRQPYFYFLNGHNDVGIASLLLATSFDNGLQFNRIRYYSPNLGRFMQKDPILGINRYSYVNNNPIRFYDPFGLLAPAAGRFFWVNPFLPAPGGSIWFDRDRCEEPAYTEDCFSNCGGQGSCVICCQTYYKGKDDPDGLNGCQIMCGYAFNY